MLTQRDPLLEALAPKARTIESEAIELAYGMLFQMSLDTRYANDWLAHQARQTLRLALDSAGQARGIAAARKARADVFTRRAAR